MSTVILVVILAITLTILHDSEQRISQINMAGKIKADIIYDETGQRIEVTGARRYLPYLYDFLMLVKDRRLESIGTIDRIKGIDGPIEVVNLTSGSKVIFYDDMEGLLKWVEGGATVAADNTVAFHGSQSLKITCAAASTTANGYRLAWLPASRKLALSFVFSCDDFSKLDGFSVDMLPYLDASSFQVQATYRAATTKAWSVTAAAGTTTILTHAQQFHADAWHYVKLKVDFNNGCYDSFQINERVIGLETIFANALAASTQRCQVTFTVDNTAGNDVNMWFDDVLLTEW